MNDEKYVFINDVREKKNIARSSRNKRTHCGKGGAVKFPSDFLSKKERNAMNGEVKYYRLNDPMKWDEFKKMPPDIKIAYVQQIRERFGVSDVKIAAMLGVEQTSFSGVVRRLGIGLGRGRGRSKGDIEGFLAWCNGVTLSPNSEPVEDSAEDVADVQEKEECETAPKEMAIPYRGSMTFDGAADAVLEAVRILLGGTNAHITVTWDVLQANVAVTADD